MTSRIAAGIRVGARRRDSDTRWDSSGRLTLVRPNPARKLFGSTATLLEPVSRCVARQVLSTTRPSVPSLRTIQSPIAKGRPSVMAMPENTSPSVFCRARPRMMAMTPEVATRVPIGMPKTKARTDRPTPR